MYLFSSLYCWVWMHICSNSTIRMYWMSVCPCSCVFGADFEQICIAEIEILCVKSLVFYASIDVKFYNFYVSVHLFCHSRENFVFDSRLRVLYKKKLLWVKSTLWSNQDNTIEFFSYSEYLFTWKNFYPVQYFTLILWTAYYLVEPFVYQYIVWLNRSYIGWIVSLTV